jgi:hypothetical protein
LRERFSSVPAPLQSSKVDDYLEARIEFTWVGNIVLQQEK